MRQALLGVPDAKGAPSAKKGALKKREKQRRTFIVRS